MIKIFLLKRFYFSVVNFFSIKLRNRGSRINEKNYDLLLFNKIQPPF